MWIQIGIVTVVFTVAFIAFIKILFTEAESVKVLYSMLLFIITFLLAVSVIVLAIQLDKAREGCPELEVIQKPVYHIKE
jgi:uncharacterized membrane protein